MSSDADARRAADVARRAAPPRLGVRDLLLLLLPCLPLAQVAVSRRLPDAGSAAVTVAPDPPRARRLCAGSRRVGCGDEQWPTRSPAAWCTERTALSACGPSAGGERAGD